MNLQAVITFIRDVPPIGTVSLPGDAGTKFSTIFGWGLAAVGVVAVLALFGAGVAFMSAKQNNQATEGPKMVAGICGGVILATVAGTIVNAVL